MGAFTAVTNIAGGPQGSLKTFVVSATGPASYDTGGSTLDVSVATLGAWLGFTTVYSCKQCAKATAATAKYQAEFIPATAGAAATGKVYVRDLTAASDAEASGDLSAVTFYFEVTGV